MLTADEAADIAKAHGLGMADAVALRTLADDRATAERIAAKWTRTEAQKWAKSIFHPPARPPSSAPDPDDTSDEAVARRFVAALFHNK